MTEKEIREVIRDLCDELDRGARRAIRQGVRKVVLPSMLGAGLAIGAAGCGDRSAPSQQDQQVSKADTEPWGAPAYGVPFPDRGADKKRIESDARKVDLGVCPPYTCPDLGEPQADYMAPFDLGIAPLYAAPDTDGEG